jgi:hypothetical protein
LQQKRPRRDEGDAILVSTKPPHGLMFTRSL